MNVFFSVLSRFWLKLGSPVHAGGSNSWIGQKER
jgi:hypothetical protein